MGRTRTSVAVLGLALAVGLGACGGGSEPSAEDQLSKAEAALAESRDAVRLATERLQQSEAAVEEATARRAEAQAALEAAAEQLREVESQVDFEVTDGLLFRIIQSRLLQDDRLADVAIRAEVERGVVTLHGEVPDEGTREAALAIVRDVPGVASVVSQIQLKASPPS